MTIRPILFSGPMVQAILNGRKTQTRRVLNPQPATSLQFSHLLGNVAVFKNQHTDVQKDVPLNFYPGDLLWVRESWQCGTTEHGPRVAFKASSDHFEIEHAWNGTDEGAGPTFNYDLFPKVCTWSTWLDDLLSSNEGSWKPSIHMPRILSRITLEITDIRVERLRDISAPDTIDEGVECETCEAMQKLHCQGERAFSAFKGCFASIQSFKVLWDSINATRKDGIYAWDKNPWVIAITFNPIFKNVDEIDLAELDVWE